MRVVNASLPYAAPKFDAVRLHKLAEIMLRLRGTAVEIAVAYLILVVSVSGCQTMPEGQSSHPEAGVPASPWSQVERRCNSAGKNVGHYNVAVDVPTLSGGYDRYYRTVNLICTPR